MALSLSAATLGYTVTTVSLTTSAHDVGLGGVDVRTTTGEPVFAADHIGIDYDPRGLLAGSRRLFGITAVRLDRPRVSILHRRDGTWNVPIPTPAGASAAQGPPPALDITVHAGSVGFDDETRLSTDARRFALDDLNVVARLHADAPGTYSVRAVAIVGGSRAEIAGTGYLDEGRGWERQQWTISAVPVAPLVNYVVNTRSLQMLGGRIPRLDVLAVGLRGADGSMVRHLFAAGALRNGRLLLGGLTEPLSDARGTFSMTEDTLLTQNLRASLGGMPLRIAGGIYDFTHPKLDLGVVGTGALPAMLRIAPASAQLPLRGAIAVRVRIEGPATTPLTLAAIDTRDVRYAGVPVDGASVRVALFGSDATILNATGRYAGLSATLRGNVTLGREVRPTIVVRADAAADRAPYLDMIVQGVPLHAIALISGTGGGRLAGRGIVSGASNAVALAGTFDVDGDGRGRVGPVTVDFRDGRSLYARAQLDKPEGTADVVALAHDVGVGPARPIALPGVRLPSIPSVSGVVNAALVGQFTRRGPALVAGEFAANGVSAGRLAITSVSAVGIGSAGTAYLSRAVARGPWGTFAARGTLNPRGASLTGTFDGRLADVGAALGQPALAGDAHVPFRMIWNGRDAIAQIDAARFARATVHGIPLEAFDGTVGLRGRSIDVYTAKAEVAGRHIVASGTFDDRNRVAVWASDLPLAALYPASPLGGGTFTAVASLGGSTRSPLADAGVVVRGATLQHVALAASTSIALRDDRVTLRDTSAVLAGAVVAASGTVAGIQSGAAPRYDLTATVRGADIGTVANAVGRHLPVPLEGRADADVVVRGSGAQPRVSGRVGIAAGSVNGLAFRDLAGAVDASALGARISSAAVTVGTSRVAVDGEVEPGARSVRVRGPRVDLADFNDFFDEADVLGGRGSVDVALFERGDGLTTHGTVSLADAHYRRFDVGDASATWATSGRDIAGRASVRGRAGDASVQAMALVPARDPLRDVPGRTTLQLDARATNVDLATWLPAANLVAPVTGYVDGDASVRGVLRTATATVHAHLHDGTVGSVPIERATIAVQARQGRLRIDDATLQMPALSVAAHGTMGLRPADPIDLSATASSPDLAQLAHAATGKALDIAGALSSQIQAKGTFAHPALQGTFDVTGGRYAHLDVPSVHAAASVGGGRAALDDGEIHLRRGTVRATGNVPFDLRHPALDPNAAIDGSLQIADLDASDFMPLLPKGTTVKGTLAGDLRVSGTLHAPVTAGSLALAGGFYASPVLRSPIANASAHLTLDGTTARLTSVHADVGRGSIDASATAVVGALDDPVRTLAFQAAASASNAQIDAPAYLEATVDGRVTVARAAGGPIRVGGALSVPVARIPLSALYNPSAAATTAAKPLPVAFDLDVDAGRDVRVQSAQVDIGGQGQVHVGGTLASPTLAGSIRSTGGTVDFYRDFQLTSGTVQFDPANGVMPLVSAVATVRVPEPDTAVTLTISGLAPNNLNVDLASDPAYDRAQILGLLVGAQQLGAISGVASWSGSPGAGQLAQSVAEGALGQQFTRSVLEPLSAHLGRGLGLDQFAINYDPGGGFQAGARKGIGRNIDAVYAETFAYPTRQSLGLESHPTPGTSVQLTFFQQQGTGQFSPQLYSTSTNQALTASQPASGTSGFSLVFQRRFFGGERSTVRAKAGAP